MDGNRKGVEVRETGIYSQAILGDKASPDSIHSCIHSCIQLCSSNSGFDIELPTVEEAIASLGILVAGLKTVAQLDPSKIHPHVDYQHLRHSNN